MMRLKILTAKTMGMGNDEGQRTYSQKMRMRKQSDCGLDVFFLYWFNSQGSLLLGQLTGCFQ